MMVAGQVHIVDHAAMVAFGNEFAGKLRRGHVVLLHGDLGAGKTTLTQGLAAGLGVPEQIQSPTFALVAEHDGVDAAGAPLRLYHLDLYRLESPADLEGIGYEKYIAPDDGVSIIEWPERAGAWLPEQFWLLRLAYAGSGGRVIECSWHDTESG